jgi:poly-gamma-glutamate synthesis protein (capsule biosynthesis protein)
VLVFALGTWSSGIPQTWQASPNCPGIDFLADLSPATADGILQRVDRVRRPGDIVVASIHWGNNWGYEVARAQVRFAHRLIDGGVDIVHGHSSHHPRPIEVYRKKLVLYGCGDFIDDYEGISGFEAFRNDLVLLHLPTVDPHSGELLRLRMVPFRIQTMRLNRASPEEAAWLRDTVHRISCKFGATVDLAGDGALMLC